jgi:hypothetical protein
MLSAFGTPPWNLKGRVSCTNSLMDACIEEQNGILTNKINAVKKHSVDLSVI